MSDPHRPRGDLSRLLRPRSVAIVGASDKPGALGTSLLANLERAGYGGTIHLVNPKRTEIGGRPCVADVAALPDGVDVAVLAIPRAAVLDTIRALASRAVGAAVIFSAGFAEGGPQGLVEQQEIARISRQAGMVVEGPNCLGLVNYVDQIPLTFVQMPMPRPSGRPAAAIVSQSGAMAAVVAVMLGSRELDVGYFISTGNEAASGVEDYVHALVDDPAVHVIAMVVELFRDPPMFVAAALRARTAGKPIVLLHPGRSAAAAASAATHTGAMAGDWRMMATMVARAGVILVETLEELTDVTELLLRNPGRFVRQGVAVLAESGAFKAMTLDLADQIGLALPQIEDADSPALRAALPALILVSNPLDLTAQSLVDPDIYARTLRALLADARFGSVLFAIIQTDEGTCALKLPPIMQTVRALSPDKPVVFAGLDQGALIPRHYIDGLRALGVTYFPSSERAIRALARIETMLALPPSAATDAGLALMGLPATGGTVAEYRAKEILAQAGIRFPPARLARTIAEAREHAQALGYPVVLKAQSAALSHKSDAGGVIVGLVDRQTLEAGWERLADNIARHRPGLVLDGVLVEAMGARGLELIVGAKNDAGWGPVILVGFGGVQAEILQDIRLLTPDLDRQAIVTELGRLKSASLLHGFRGAPALDMDALADLVLTLARVLRGTPSIREIDLNPVIIYPKGEGILALDALIECTPP